MDEIIHECTTSSSIVFPSSGPTIVLATSTPSHVAKPYSTPRCDKYPTGGTPCPTTNGAVSKPRAHTPYEIQLIAISSSPMKKIFVFKHAVVNTECPLNLLQPPQKQLQLQPENP
jgi:hypothetical protein